MRTLVVFLCLCASSWAGNYNNVTLMAHWTPRGEVGYPFIVDLGFGRQVVIPDVVMDLHINEHVSHESGYGDHGESETSAYMKHSEVILKGLWHAQVKGAMAWYFDPVYREWHLWVAQDTSKIAHFTVCGIEVGWVKFPFTFPE